MKLKAVSLLTLLLPFASFAQPIASAADVEGPCASVEVSKPFVFHGRRLEEIPDIREPELRLANQFFSSGCWGHGYQKLDEYEKAHPQDNHHHYVRARFRLMYGRFLEAESELRTALDRDPDFHSAKVLLAFIRQQQDRYAEARQLIGEVEKRSPSDLWVFMNNLRFEAREKPTPRLRKQLMEILRNPQFPPNAREEAAALGMSLPRQSNEEVEEFMWARLDVTSSIDEEFKIFELAKRLSEVGNRFEQARGLLESERARNLDFQQFPLAKILLAQAYLIEAAKISPRPTADNEAYIDKATVALQANYRALRQYVEHRPQAKVLEPFLTYKPKPETADAEGRTPLCNAVRELDIERVVALLDRGANPNGRCEGYSIIGHVMLNNPRTKNRERQAITHILLSRDAEPRLHELHNCELPKYGDCGLILLPIITREME